MLYHILQLHEQKRIFLQVSGPSAALIFSKSQIFLIFDLCFGWGMKNRSRALISGWWQSKTRRSVSSPTRTVVIDLVDWTAIWTIIRSASPGAWIILHPESCSFSPSSFMSLCLLAVSLRNTPFFSFKTMSPSKFTDGPKTQDLLWCAQSFVEGPCSYPSNTTVDQKASARMGLLEWGIK